VLVDRLARADQRDRHEERRQDDEEDRDAVDARLEVGAEPRNPLGIENELEPIALRVEVIEDEERDQERDRRERDAEPTVEGRLGLRRAHHEQRTEDRQRQE
jgi:hypothetical protein